MKGSSSVAPTPESGQTDGYLDHMAALSQSHAITAGTDIYNERGMLLAKKGMALKPELAEKLKAHRLAVSLDEALSIGRCLNRSQIVQLLSDFLAPHTDLLQFHQRNNFQAPFEQLCHRREIPYPLLSRLTVLQARLPELFERSLFVAWLGSQMAEEMRLSSDLVYDTFVAGLLHDVGYLHLPESAGREAIRAGDDQLSQQIGHIGCVLAVMARSGVYTDTALRAIAEHHEHSDGSGLPQGKTARQLTVVGRILELCDWVYDRRFDPAGSADANLLVALPFLRVNAETHFLPVHQALYALLQRAGLQPVAAHATPPAHLPEQLAGQADRLQRLFTELIALNDCLLAQVAPNQREQLLSVTSQIMKTMRSAGLASDELVSWLSALRQSTEPEAAGELREMQETLYELTWLAKRACRVIRREVDSCPPEVKQQASKLDELLAQLEVDLTAAWQLRRS